MCNQCLGIFSPSASACDIQGWIGNINGGEDNMPLINWLRKVKRLKVSSFDLRLRRALSLTPNVNSNWFLHRAVPDKHFYSTAPHIRTVQAPRDPSATLHHFRWKPSSGVTGEPHLRWSFFLYKRSPPREVSGKPYPTILPFCTVK